MLGFEKPFLAQVCVNHGCGGHGNLPKALSEIHGHLQLILPESQSVLVSWRAKSSFGTLTLLFQADVSSNSSGSKPPEQAEIDHDRVDKFKIWVRRFKAEVFDVRIVKV
jgi:hypothetical protein